jgi:hypothetical protein
VSNLKQQAPARNSVITLCEETIDDIFDCEDGRIFVPIPPNYDADAAWPPIAYCGWEPTARRVESGLSLTLWRCTRDSKPRWLPGHLWRPPVVRA